MDERSEILRLNSYLRNNNGVRETDGIRWALSIPTDDYAKLITSNPALNSRDRAEQQKAWQTFIASDVSLPYRVMEKI